MTTDVQVHLGNNYCVRDVSVGSQEGNFMSVEETEALLSFPLDSPIKHPVLESTLYDPRLDRR